MADLRVVGAGDPVQWFKEGWRLFVPHIANWILMALIFGVIAIVLSYIPFLGVLALYIIMPLLQGGMFYSAQKADQGQETEIMDLFVMFKDEKRRTPLVILGLLMTAIAFVLMIIVGGTLFASAQPMTGQDLPMLPTIGATGLLMALLSGLLMAMLFMFATPLVIFKNMSPIEAIKTSFTANLKNLPAFLVFALIYAVLAIIAAIPFGLGFLVLVPVAVIATYAAYKRIFA